MCAIRSLKNDDDEKIGIYYLKQFKGINIYNYQLPSEFGDLNKKEKYALIFKKENIEQYFYKLNENQINLINKINDIRKQYNLSPSKYSEYENLPEFLINEKTELNFYPYQNIYKLNEGLYIFKYPKNEFHKLLNTKEILNIITNDLLDKIYIIEQNNFEFICPYSNIIIYDKISYHLSDKNNNMHSNKNEPKLKDIILKLIEILLKIILIILNINL